LKSGKKPVEMGKRYVCAWFRFLETDWFLRRHPAYAGKPFVLSRKDHGRMVVAAANALAQQEGIAIGMPVADARAIYSSLEVKDEVPALADALLTKLAKWSIRFSPAVAVDPYHGLIIDATGCAHLWGGEESYLTAINNRFKENGYYVRLAMADTIGAAWALSRFGKQATVVSPGQQISAMITLPPQALRIDPLVVERLEKLGLRTIGQFIHLPMRAMRRRFGAAFVLRLSQAIGYAEEFLTNVEPVVHYYERLPCLEPISTATGIEIALDQLLSTLCARLASEEKGIRKLLFKCYRIDSHEQTLEVGTTRASNQVAHLKKLFEEKLPTIEPALGIELFVLEAPIVEQVTVAQEKIWEETLGLHNTRFTQLIDRLCGKFGLNVVNRYLPDEHYWPERAFHVAESVHQEKSTEWRTDRPRPIHLLQRPEPIEVTAPIPDYPPMLFRHRGVLHKVSRADGPERIEQEWWLQQGDHRDYYTVEDQDGKRFWVFRAGHPQQAVPGTPVSSQWFIHGFFA
jgi:protein ImuB